MALYAGIQMVAGDRMKVEFRTGHTQVEGVVRSKAGCCFGVEFMAPLAEKIEGQYALRIPQMPFLEAKLSSGCC